MCYLLPHSGNLFQPVKLFQSGTSSEVLKATQGQAEIKYFREESPDAAGSNTVGSSGHPPGFQSSSVALPLNEVRQR